MTHLPTPPGIRPLDPDGLLRLAAGKTTSTLLQLALELDLFAKLSGRAVPLADLAATWAMPGPSARLVAQYLTNAGLLVYRDGEVSNGPLAAAMLCHDSELRRALALPMKYDLSRDALHDLLFHPPMLHWYQLRDQGEISDQRPLYKNTHENWVGELAEQRHALRIQNGKRLAARYDFTRHHKLLDLGGSSGGLCFGIREHYPHLACVVFDLPEAAAVARAKVVAADASAWCEVVAGSFFTTPLPSGADVALLANVLHTWAPAEDLTLLRLAWDVLPAGGTVLVREAFFEDDWSGSIEAVFDGFVLIGKEGMSGWQPTYAEMENLLREAGFGAVERRPELVIGRKPEL